MTDQCQPTEADGVNVIECGTLTVNSDATRDYEEATDTVYTLTVIGTARYRVLLERIEG